MVIISDPSGKAQFPCGKKRRWKFSKSSKKLFPKKYNNKTNSIKIDDEIKNIRLISLRNL